MHSDFILQERIAYFSMEIALQNDIPTYAGGLGVLAGDTLRSGADLELPLVAVSLVSRQGYFRQEIDSSGCQFEKPDAWDPTRYATPLNAKIAVPIEGREVWVRGWLHVLHGYMNGREPVILLDTDLDENSANDRRITDRLYGGDTEYRLKQEIVLGIGGARLLQALGFTIRQYHMNEGHSALLALELLRRHAYLPNEIRNGSSPYDVPRVRSMCNFTTHTPVESGHDKFGYELVQRVLGDFVEIPMLKELGGTDALDMTKLAFELSDYVNGVAKRHAEVSRRFFPGYRVHSVTNGVHPCRWTCPCFVKLYDTHFPGWCHEPELLVRADHVPDAAIWNAHLAARAQLIDQVKAMTGVELHPKIPILGFARRMTAYKRADLLFTDLTRLADIAQQRSFQIVLAGKAHPNDTAGKRLIEALHHHMRDMKGIISMAFLPNYDLDIALTLISGVDVWLNTPLKPLEASGTSGMKAAFNGVPQLGILDGWWIEGCIEGVTGWAIGDSSQSSDNDAASLYDKLENVVLPLYYGYSGNQAEWIAVMKGAISKNASFFNSLRMIRRYATEAYIR